MKFVLIFSATLSVFAAVQTASAASVSQREYKRGYNDCFNGRYDQNQHGSSYKKGCRAAEDKLAKNKPADGGCPADVAQADRYLYPACK